MYVELHETMEKHTKLNPNEIYDVTVGFVLNDVVILSWNLCLCNLEKPQNKSL